MAKRGATSELNHDNWNDDEEPEEAGVFIQADKETLQHRVIKKAKRRGTGSEDGAKTSAFSGFGGLGSVTKSNTFSGFSMTSGGSSKLGGTGIFSSAIPTPTPVNGSKDQTDGSTTIGSRPPNKGQGDWKESPAYFSFLKALNLSVLSWIKQHVEENPYIILTPVFKDYERYLQKQEAEACSTSEGPDLASLAKKHTQLAQNSDDATLPVAPSATKTDGKANLFSAQTKSKEESSAANKAETVKTSTASSAVSSSEASKGFSFGTTSFKASGVSGNFSFGSTKATNATTTPAFGESGLSFGAVSTAASTTSSSGFSFGTTTSPAPATTASSSGFSFGKTTSTASTTAPSSGFSFGTTSTAATTTSGSSGFSFGAATSGTAKPLFSFGASSSTPATSGFSFGVASQSASSSGGASQGTNGKNEDDEYVPPKPEVREIKEDDSLYSKRCKLYFQRNDQWVDKGVGNVHLKPVEGSKTQLLVRADTNLGNILLNVMLSETTPVSRQGKNNVLVVCVPNPPLDSKASEDEQKKPVPMLLRVKAGEDADQLFAKIEERKGKL